MEKEYGAGILFFTKKPKRVLLFVRDQKHPNPAKTLPFPGMLAIPGGHLEAGEAFAHCIMREIAEEWTDLRTGKPFELRDFWFLEKFEDDTIHSVIFCKEMDFSLMDIDYNEGAALALMNEAAAMRTEIAYGRTELLRRFFKSAFMNA